MKFLTCLLHVSIPYRYKQNFVYVLDKKYIQYLFQSPIGTNKTLYGVCHCSIPFFVSIPYRYKQNQYQACSNSSKKERFQSPIGTNKTNMEMVKNVDVKRFNPLQVQTKLSLRKRRSEYTMSFNPLQVQTKPSQAITKYGWENRFNPLQVQTKQEGALDEPFEDEDEFQSPIGTNKTHRLSKEIGCIITVSIPYRYKQK